MANGGTGSNSLTDHYVLVGAGTSAVTLVATGTAGRIFVDQGGGNDPAFVTTGLHITQHYASVNTPSGSSGTITCDLSQSDWQTLNAFTGNVTVALSNPTVGQTFYIEATQASSGGPYSITWFSGITWIGAPYTAPAMPTTASAVLTAIFRCTGTNTYRGWWLGNSAT